MVVAAGLWRHAKAGAHAQAAGGHRVAGGGEEGARVNPPSVRYVTVLTPSYTVIFRKRFRRVSTDMCASLFTHLLEESHIFVIS